MFNILVVEDDLNIKKLICENLRRENYTIFEAENGDEACNVYNDTYIDLVITDLMMPVCDGFELISRLRKKSRDLPILVLTAKDALSDKKEGFESGADDYITKPFEMEELLLRVKAMLRRNKIASEKMLVFGDVKVDYNGNSVIYSKGKIDFPRKEFLLLFKLLSTPNRVFTRLEIMDEIWGNDSDDRTIDVHIRRLREKLEDISEFEITTVRGLGYKAVVR